MKDTRNQRQEILDHLRKNGELTSFEAYEKLHITQFATRISELEERGYEFRKIWDYSMKDGKKKKFKRYYLINDVELTNMNHIPNIL